MPVDQMFQNATKNLAGHASTKKPRSGEPEQGFSVRYARSAIAMPRSPRSFAASRKSERPENPNEPAAKCQLAR